MDSGQSDGQVRNGSFYWYLRRLLSDFRPASVEVLAKNPEFETRLSNLCIWYDQMTQNLHTNFGLPMTHPPLLSALANGEEFLLRALSNAELSPEALSFRVTYPRLIRFNGRVELFFEIELQSADPYSVSRGTNCCLTFWAYADRYEDEAGAADGGGRGGSDGN
ncbi:hypothetical protein M758_8G067300 [Ceratodon purpureus]|uniref:Uncharacterized protein n=1 Tax=Ceratodon purpureus TaxID=3225 RepID=A0A8T0GY49_CERPU|nr:hypothetical protein KC19_8G071400 [Ceratodon purpureus]KAG0607966.1 hypothetical protein M758_8G067300 [Ceratodon purpureus]